MPRRYREQGPGVVVPGRGYTIAKILRERRGVLTAIDFDDGSTVVTDSAIGGRDMGDEWEHLYLEAAGGTLLASTRDIFRLRDPETGTWLYERATTT